MDLSGRETSSGSPSQTDLELTAARPDGPAVSFGCEYSPCETSCAQAPQPKQHDEDSCSGSARQGTGDNEQEASGDEDDDQWMPGQVHDILLGGSEAQELVEEAHDMGLKVVVVLWLAAWSAAATDAASALTLLAAEHSHVMFLCLDVEASEDNTNLAFEKVMAPSTSQRKGAKPVPKSGHKWPVLTLHVPPNLHVEGSFAGAAAVSSLRSHLLREEDAYTPEPPEEGGHDGEAEAASSAQETPGDSFAEACPETASTDQTAEAERVWIYTDGAADMRKCYKHADSLPVAALTLIHDSAQTGSFPSSLHSSWAASARLHTDVVLATMDVSASSANSALAGKLAKNLKLPALLVKRRPGTEAATEKASSVQLVQNIGCKTLMTTLAEQSNIPRDPPIGHKEPTRKGSLYDPPQGSAKRPGVYRKFPKGDAVYWPRMPCLRCGCPWWLGEDWDAVCVRCRWCCETEGYDNDSRPLKKGGWHDRYVKFTAYLREGRTAPWPPVKPLK